MRGLVQCDNVFVAKSADKGVGVFAANDISAGQIVERGIVRRLPTGFDGNTSPYVFTWSDDRTVWAIGSVLHLLPLLRHPECEDAPRLRNRYVQDNRTKSDLDR